jgi:hypothetical protein
MDAKRNENEPTTGIVANDSIEFIDLPKKKVIKVEVDIPIIGVKARG